MSSTFTLRQARNSDGAAAYRLVSEILTEFGMAAEPEGTDSDLRDIERNYLTRGGDFVVIESPAGEIVGTCGLYPLEPGVVELRKMYIAKAHRGHGDGRRLLGWALARAAELGFKKVRLETAAVLKDAIALYELNGFTRDCGGIHTSRCDSAYVRDL